MGGPVTHSTAKVLVVLLGCGLAGGLIVGLLAPSLALLTWLAGWLAVCLSPFACFFLPCLLVNSFTRRGVRMLLACPPVLWEGLLACILCMIGCCPADPQGGWTVCLPPLLACLSLCRCLSWCAEGLRCLCLSPPAVWLIRLSALRG